jgi:pimeloyl-ACP methyl ester carboxylesterase
MLHGDVLDSGKSLFVTAPDGLKLHVREYGACGAPGLSVVCLPGLCRTVADFDELAPALSHGPLPRRVIAIDSRGRGHSEHDTDHCNYNCMTELTDICTILRALDVGPAIFVGSSRGGILTMMLGATHPTAVAGVVLHDVGPVTEQKGIARIRGYIGHLPHPRTYEEGADILRELMGPQFPKLTATQWLAGAQRTWHLKNGALKPAYDVGIARALGGIDIERPLPCLWNEFDALADVPLLVIRGGNSDILSEATVNAMRDRRPQMDLIEVPDEGHAPLLEGELLGRIVRFAGRCDATRYTAKALEFAAV